MTSITTNTKRNSTQQYQPDATVHVKENGHMTETGEGPDKLLIGFMDRMARACFGAQVDHWRAIAEGLEAMSEDVRQKRFDKLLPTANTIQGTWDLYEKTYKVIGPIFMAYFAPRAFTPDDFVFESSCEAIYGEMPKMTCPCCKGETFDNNDAFPPSMTDGHLRASFFCRDCGFPLDAILK